MVDSYVVKCEQNNVYTLVISVQQAYATFCEAAILQLTSTINIMRSLLSTFNMPTFVPKLKSSCMALLGLADTPPKDALWRIETIREQMLAELGDYGDRKFPAIVRRVRFAPDVQGLWYARSDVMAILSNTYGETIAREKMLDISCKFVGLLPKSVTKRSALRSR